MVQGRGSHQFSGGALIGPGVGLAPVWGRGSHKSGGVLSVFPQGFSAAPPSEYIQAAWGSVKESVNLLAQPLPVDSLLTEPPSHAEPQWLGGVTASQAQATHNSLCKSVPSAAWPMALVKGKQHT